MHRFTTIFSYGLLNALVLLAFSVSAGAQEAPEPMPVVGTAPVTGTAAVVGTAAAPSGPQTATNQPVGQKALTKSANTGNKVVKKLVKKKKKNKKRRKKRRSTL